MPDERPPSRRIDREPPADFEPPADEEEGLVRIALLSAEVAKIDYMLGDEHRRSSMTDREYNSWRRRAIRERSLYARDINLLEASLKPIRKADQESLLAKLKALERENARRHAYWLEQEARNQEVRRLIESVEIVAKPVRLLAALNRLLARHLKACGTVPDEASRATIEEVRDFLKTAGHWSPPFNQEPTTGPTGTPDEGQDRP